ncbi:prostatic acid phosphatase [Halyomorpha halys]|uniref:prostatic acid phosphatase n=1 Tax=Halyomorpha halys TaxID=286706 RepID=UPI0006D51969|nr:prostatic acid phosphatase-like [Halyomorpha halys]
MKIINYMAILFWLFLICNLGHVLSRQTDFPNTENQLIFTSILFRHGQRNPNGFYTRDPYKNMSYWPDGLGMLTKTGKLREYELGQWLGKRYKSLIPDGKYSEQLVYIQSTDVDRTLMSAQANLAGLFYPSKEEMWSDLPWQPIPVHTVPKKLDKLLKVEFPCPRLQKEEKIVRKSKFLKKYNKERKQLYKYLTKHTGDKVKEPQHCGTIYTNLLIESQTISNFTIPDWAEKIYPDLLHQIGGFSFSIPTSTTILKRLRGGPLLKDIITHMKLKRNGTLDPNRNLWLYSAHDDNVAALLNTMGVFEHHMPPFVATVMIDLRKNAKNEFFVEVHYRNSTAEPTLLTIPGCTPSCPLDEFESYLSQVIPGDWDTECKH